MKEATHPCTRGWTWAQVPQHAVAILREEGLKSLWVKLLDKTICRWEVLVEHPLDGPIPEISVQVPLEIGLLDKSEVEEYVRFRPGTDPSEIHRRLKAGQWCFVARHNGRMVYASWVAADCIWLPYLNRELRLAPDEIYGYDAFTVQDYRGQNIAPAMYSWIKHYLRNAGYRRTIMLLAPNNKGALRSDRKARSSSLGVIGYVKLGPWRWNFCRVRPGARPPGAIK